MSGFSSVPSTWAGCGRRNAAGPRTRGLSGGRAVAARRVRPGRQHRRPPDDRRVLTRLAAARSSGGTVVGGQVVAGPAARAAWHSLVPPLPPAIVDSPDPGVVYARTVHHVARATQDFRPHRGGPGRRPGHRGRRVLLVARAVGFRENHRVAVDRRLRAAHLRADSVGRQGCQPDGALRPGREHGFPGLRTLSAYERARQRRVRTEGQGRSQSGTHPARRAGFGDRTAAAGGEP